MMMMMMNNDYTKIVKSRVSGFSRAKLEAGGNVLGLCTARDESKCCCCVFSRPSYIGFLAELEGVLYADHVRFHAGHPYLERLPTL